MMDNNKISDAAPLHQLSNTELYVIAKTKVKHEPIITDFKISPIDCVNGNLGEYFNVEMTITEDTGETQKHKFFMKTLPMDSWTTDFLSDGVFQKEVIFYKDFSGCIKEFLSTDVFPECYLAVPGKIVMADAATQDYRPLRDITEHPLDYEHTKIGLMALARLHVGSIIYEEKTGRKVNTDFPDLAREPNFKPGSQGLDFLRTGGEALAALVPHLETDIGKDPDAMAHLQEQVGPWMNKLEYYLSENYPNRQVICHGDSWPANFLYRYDDQGRPISAILIDFQLTRFRSPAVDVNTFMYLSMPADDLKKWRESLLDVYYQVITEEMKHCGLDADVIYPKEEFLQACTHYQIVGLIYTLLYLPFLRIPNEIKEEASSTNEKAVYFYYKDRRQHLINWYKEYPILRRFVNSATDELYQNFIKTTRDTSRKCSRV